MSDNGKDCYPATLETLKLYIHQYFLHVIITTKVFIMRRRKSLIDSGTVCFSI